MKTFTLLLLSLLATAAIFAQPYPPKDYQLSNDKATLVKWNGDEPHIDMKADDVLKNVKHIGAKAFEDKYIKTILFPNGLETIGDWAFHRCQDLEKLSLPEELKSIGSGAFLRCKRISGDLIIPNSVTEIRESAFRECSGFTGTLKIGNQIKTIEKDAFSGCSGFSGDLIIPNSVTDIELRAFQSCSGFRALVIGNSVTKISNAAFANTRFTVIKCLAETAPELHTRVAQAPFFKVPLIVPANSLTQYKNNDNWKKFSSISAFPIPNDYEKDGNTLVKWKGSQACIDLEYDATLKEVKHIGAKAFRNNTTLTNIILPEGLESIGERAINDCKELSGTLSIPDNVIKIGEWAFAGNPKLTALSLGEKLQKIEKGAFKGCEGLKGDLIIPNSVTSIGAQVFQDCSGLNGILKIGTDVTSIGNLAFENTTGFTALEILATTPPTVTGNPSLNTNLPLTVLLTSAEAYQKHEYWKKFTNIIKISLDFTIKGDTLVKWMGEQAIIDMESDPDLQKVKHIGAEAFRESKTLTSIILPKGLESIGEYAFYYCEKLSGTLSIPDNVIKIEKWAFGGNSKLTALSLGEKLQKIENYVFRDCCGLKGDLIIPNSVESIGSEVFQYCSGFNGILKIGTNVTSIGDLAFHAANAFTALEVFATIPPSVTGDPSLNTNLSLTIPRSSAEAYQKHEYWKKFTNIIKINTDYIIRGDTLVKWNVEQAIVDMQADPELQKIKHIGAEVFRNSKTLTSIILPKGLESIGERAINDCKELSGTLSIPDNVITIGEWAFAGNPKLTALSLGEKLKKIEKGAFKGCVGLTGDLIIPNSVESIGELAFTDNTKLTALSLGEGVKNIEKAAFKDCKELTGDLIIPNSVTSIGEWAFAGNPKLTALSIGEGVQKIEKGVFNGCEGLTGDLIIPNNVTSIGEWAFADNPNLTALSLGEKLQKIKRGAFKGCEGFKGNLIIPNSVDSIGAQVFELCSGFDGGLRIGTNVKKIGKNAFGECNGLKDIKMLATSPPDAFEGDLGLNTNLTLTVPEGTVDTYKNDHYWQHFAANITTSINKTEALAEGIRFYPSPVRDMLTVECEKGIEAYSLYSATAALLQYKKTNEKQVVIDMANYPSGIYFLHLLSKEGTKIIKLIKK